MSRGREVGGWVRQLSEATVLTTSVNSNSLRVIPYNEVKESSCEDNASHNFSSENI